MSDNPTRPVALGEDEIDLALKSLEGWDYHEDAKAFIKSYAFENFNEAFGFMNAVALMAEQLNHHPEWLNVYNRVDVKLTTHDVGAVTGLDVVLATYMNEVAG